MNRPANHTPRGISVHIGVNRCDPAAYNGSWDGAMSSAENDVDTMEEIARRQGFETRVLKSEQATRENVTDAFRSAASELQAGDFFLVTYSGHGDHVPDISGDEEDRLDDTWCLHNGHFLDDELNVLLAGFRPGCRILVLSDSCHSGTMLKGGASSADNSNRVQDEYIYSRAVPRSASIESYKSHRQYYAEMQLALPKPRPEIRASVRLLSGCQEDEQSWGSEVAGRFTEAVKTVFADGAFEGGYKQFHAELVKAVAKAMNPQTPGHSVIGVPSREFDSEKPFSI